MVVEHHVVLTVHLVLRADLHRFPVFNVEQVVGGFLPGELVEVLLIHLQKQHDILYSPAGTT